MARVWARVWALALMAQAILALGPARMREAMRSAVGAVDSGFAKDGMAPRADALATRKGLRCFQVANPVMTPEGMVVDDEIIDGPSPYSSSCQVTLMDHVFANSYGEPFVAKYKPPSCAFNRVVINFTVVSEGRQYDRLAVMWLGDTEVWRTSTAEPKAHPGIAWTYWKDMTSYLSLWRQPQTLIFDLGNLVNEKYTGSFNATLTATFTAANLQGSQAPPADEIVPVSARRGRQGRGSAFTYPEEQAQSLVRLPRNIKRAVVSIAANGQADEEFWWSNVPEAGVKTWANLTLPGLSSFREVRLWIDGNLAGLSWPFPVVFTGGISPPLHRPLVGPQAFDLREQEIDVTPWLGLLCNGRQHNFTMEVVGEGDAVVHKYWVLSAKIFLWLGKEGSVTTGSRPTVKVSAPDFKPYVQVSPNRYLRYQQTVNRALRITSHIKQGDKVTSKSWSQQFNMTNDGYLKSGGDFQQVEALYRGQDTAGEEEDLLKYYFSAYTYPISTTYQSKAPDGRYSMTLDANLTQGMELVSNGLTAFPNGVEPFLYKLYKPQHGTNVKTFRTGHAFFYQLDGGNSSGGFGSTHQAYALAARGFAGTDDPEFESDPLLYSRDVTVQNETVTQDRQYVYKSDKGTIDRKAPPYWTSWRLDDQFAPHLTRGRGGSRVYSKDQKTVNNVKILMPPRPPPPPAKVVEEPAEEAQDKLVPVPEKPADKVEDKLVPAPEKPTNEKPGEDDSLETLIDELKKQLTEEIEKEVEEHIRKQLEESIRKKLGLEKEKDKEKDKGDAKGIDIGSL